MACRGNPNICAIIMRSRFFGRVVSPYLKWRERNIVELFNGYSFDPTSTASNMRIVDIYNGLMLRSDHSHNDTSR